MEIDDVITCICQVPMVLYSLSALCYQNQPPTVQNTNEPIRDGLKMSHQLVGVWSECPVFCESKIKKISSEESVCFSAKICTSENFLLYGIPPKPTVNVQQVIILLMYIVA